MNQERSVTKTVYELGNDLLKKKWAKTQPKWWGTENLLDFI